MGLAIAQVRDGQHVFTSQEIFHTRHPHRFEIEQMARVLLGRPLVSRFQAQHIARYAEQHLFQSRRGAAQAILLYDAQPVLDGVGCSMGCTIWADCRTSVQLIAARDELVTVSACLTAEHKAC